MTLLKQRLSVSNGQRSPNPLDSSCTHFKKPTPPSTSPELYRSDQLPSWYAHNSFIHTSYRPITNSTRLCISTLSYMHNETVNMYSHLIPAVLVLLSICLFNGYFAERYLEASWVDQLVFYMYLTTSFICFATSATYHTLQCHSERYASLWVRLDHVGIVTEIVGSLIPGVYFEFYCEPKLQKVYWTMVSMTRWM
jgi:adiponectin receptor